MTLSGAAAQAEAVRRILPNLTEEETAIFRRGRNHTLPNVPKSATMQEYRHATGFEVLLAALYVDGKNGRLHELFTLAYTPQIEALRAELGLKIAPSDSDRKDTHS